MIGSLFCSLGKSLGACELKTPPLTFWGDMDVYEVSSILIEKFQDAPLYLPDAYYKTCSKLDMERFLAWDMTNRERYEPEAFDCEVPEDVAFGLGLFFADGSCMLRENQNYAGANWRLVNWKLDALLKTQDAFNNQWTNLDFRVREYPSYAKGSLTNYGERKKTLYCLEVAPKERHNDGSRGEFIKVFSNTIYRNGKKKVPAGILESPARSKKAFLEGVIEGDGSLLGRYGGCITCQGRLSVLYLIDLLLDCGWKFYIREEKRANDVFEIYYNRKTENLTATPACDDFSWRLKGNITIKPWSSVPFFVVWTDLHALNGFISEDRKWHFIEPQTDTIQDSLEAWQGSQIRFIGG